jgi:hypothetical protein
MQVPGAQRTPYSLESGGDGGDLKSIDGGETWKIFRLLKVYQRFMGIVGVTVARLTQIKFIHWKIKMVVYL